MVGLEIMHTDVGVEGVIYICRNCAEKFHINLF